MRNTREEKCPRCDKEMLFMQHSTIGTFVCLPCQNELVFDPTGPLVPYPMEKE